MKNNFFGKAYVSSITHRNAEAEHYKYIHWNEFYSITDKEDNLFWQDADRQHEIKYTGNIYEQYGLKTDSWYYRLIEGDE